MLIASDSLQIRRAAIAYVFPGVLELRRQECMAFYDALAREVGDYPDMRQQYPNGFALIRRTPPDSVGEVVVNRVDAAQPTGATMPAGMRFLFAESGSAKPGDDFAEQAKLAFDAFTSTWGNVVGRVQLIEVAFAATLAVSHPQGSTGFIGERILSAAKDVGHLGRNFPMATIKLVSPLTVGTWQGPAPDPVPGATVELTIEPWNADARLMFVNAICKWPAMHVNLQDLALPPEARAAMGGGNNILEVNQETRPPDHYVGLALQFVKKNVVPYLASLAR